MGDTYCFIAVLLFTCFADFVDVVKSKCCRTKAHSWKIFWALHRNGLKTLFLLMKVQCRLFWFVIISLEIVVESLYCSNNFNKLFLIAFSLTKHKRGYSIIGQYSRRLHKFMSLLYHFCLHNIDTYEFW